MVAFQTRQMGFGMGLTAKQVRQLGTIMSALYRLFQDKDLSLIEVNPLIITGAGDLLALDAKINTDDNALFRHPQLATMRDEAQEDPTEVAASRHDLAVVSGKFVFAKGGRDLNCVGFVINIKGYRLFW